MRVTAGCLLAFEPVLEPADLASPPGPSTNAWPERLIRCEGALAWEGSQPRSAVPPMALPWAEDAWLAGWDQADARFYHADGPPECRDAA